MKDSAYKSNDELPLFLNAKTVARVLGISPSSGSKREVREMMLYKKVDTFKRFPGQ